MSRARRAYGLAAALLLLTPALTAAQDTQTGLGLWIGGGGGGGFPLGDFNDASKTGWNAMGHISLVPAGWPIAIRFEGQYGRYKEDVPFNRATIKPAVISANLVLPLVRTGTIRPYIFGGGGVAVVRIGFPDGSSDTESSGAYDAGGGLNFYSTSWLVFFVEGRFQGIPKDDIADLNYGALIGGVRLKLH